MTESPVWQPDANQIEQTQIRQFMQRMSARWGQGFESDYAQFHQWTVAQPQQFWLSVWEEFSVIGDLPADAQVLTDSHRLPGARWFPDARLNYAENLLRVDARSDDSVVMVSRDELGNDRQITQRELVSRVASFAQWLEQAGIGPGDRVAGYLPNVPETIMVMLAATSIGAVWSSCSPDFGVRGVLDRFGQIDPEILIVPDAYYYNGKLVDCADKVRDIHSQLSSIKKTVVVNFAGTGQIDGIENCFRFDEVSVDDGDLRPRFARLPFDHPLYIMYSSGTTGVPKCIVHGAGGVLMKHLTEHRLHSDVRAGDRLFYFTTCGWMMWNWLVSGLAADATVVLYDGSPFYPDANAMFDYIDQAGINIFGTSAKFIDACNKEGLRPVASHDLSSMRTLLSTGSPLVPEAFDYVFSGIKKNVCLSSISGGTDIVGCFALGNPALPVWRGELQCMAVGLDVAALGPDGERLAPGKRGELACLNPFPSVPVSFWNDPDGRKFHKAYFDRFDNVWCHGDYVETTEHGGMIIHGRSDAVLNPGGVRIGTAEIYAHVETIDEIVESVVIGQRGQDDVRVVLFVRCREGVDLDEALEARIKKVLRDNASPRHVPAVIVQIADIPRTRSGKIAEIAVRNVVHGDAVENREALANPEALELYVGLEPLSQ